MIISSRCKLDRISHHDKRVDGEGQQQMFQRSIILTLTVLLTLSACGDTSMTNEDVDATITAGIAQASLALTQSPVPTPAPTSTPSPTPTAPPTSPPNPTATPTSAPSTTLPSSPTSTLTPTATPPYISRPCNASLDQRIHSLDRKLLAHGGNSWQGNDNLQWTPDGSQILFTFGYEETGVYAVDADGSSLQTIVDPLVNSVRANRGRPVGLMTYFDISPDGSQIVYSTCRYPDSDGVLLGERESWEYSYEIVVSNIDGTNTRRITNNDHFDNFPVWSPDGSQIAFVSDPDPDRDAHETRGLLMVYTMATGELRDITPFYGDKDRVAPHPPSWSPDGRHIAFVVYDYHDGDVESDEEGWYRGPLVEYTVGSDGKGRSRISRVFSEPSWSPDGARIAMVAPWAEGAGLFTFAPDGSGPSFVARITDEVYDFWESRRYGVPETWLPPVYWSPDRSRILFTKYMYPYRYDPYDMESRGPPYAFDIEDERCMKHLCAASADGTSVTSVSGLRLPSLGDSLRGDLRGDFVGDPALSESLSWSPDGSRIAVLARTTFGAGSTILYTMDRNGNDVRILVRLDEGGKPIAWKSNPVDLDSCSNGVVVPDPAKSPGLVEDCRTLLTVRDVLGGSVSLELSQGWRTDRPIAEWGDGYSLGVGVGGDPPRIRSLILYGSHGIDSPPIHTLFGRIPPELGNLAELRELDLEVNELVGPIPPELGKLTNLEILNLKYNYLSGGIPAELGNLTNLRELHLGNNQLTGSIPADLGNLPNLERLDLVSTGRESNRFTGCVPMALVDKIVDFVDLGLPPCEQALDGR